MANAQRGEASIKIGEVTYTLQYGWNAIASIETITGLTMGEVGQMITSDNFHGAMFRAVFWGVLRKYHSEIDIEAAGDLMDHGDPKKIMAAVNSALSSSVIATKAGAKNPPNAGQ